MPSLYPDGGVTSTRTPGHHRSFGDTYSMLPSSRWLVDNTLEVASSIPATSELTFNSSKIKPQTPHADDHVKPSAVGADVIITARSRYYYRDNNGSEQPQSALNYQFASMKSSRSKHFILSHTSITK
ncbi:hypothetical protein EVAR_97524_1 [Eumeta japonica]|uniref:Uncharacterized protein n=1 Tax=Eumeta variegata TaxID=151549 RepID=A0A4C1WPP6_EUMVA|nr:hypothetical protein EVAR_97524_1 [Eumeta japonica]